MIFIETNAVDELFKNILIPDFPQVQRELLSCIKHDYKENPTPHAFNYSKEYLTKTCPTLMNWLTPRSKMFFRLLRFYVTPPRQTLGAHIDGGGKAPLVPFGINIPVTGCENTYHTFYQCPPENIRPDTPDGYLGGLHPIDYNKITPMKRLEILKPCFTNNSVMHGVENESDNYRVMFTVRWILHPTIGRKIDEVIDTTNLFVND